MGWHYRKLICQACGEPGFRETTFDSSVTVSGRVLPYTANSRASGVCRLPPPARLFSASASKKAAPRQEESGFRYVPTADPQRMKMGGNLRPTADIGS